MLFAHRLASICVIFSIIASFTSFTAIAQPPDTIAPCAAFTRTITTGEKLSGFALELSPDGATVVYQAGLTLSTSLIYSAPTDGSATPVVVSTSIPDTHRLYFFTLHPDGEHVIYVTREESVYAVFSAPIRGGEALLLGEASDHPDPNLRYPSVFVLDENSQNIYVRAERDGALGIDRVSLSDGSSVRVIGDTVDGLPVEDYSLSPDGSQFLVAGADAENQVYALYLVSATSGEVQALDIGLPPLDRFYFPILLADAKKLQVGSIGTKSNGLAGWSATGDSILYAQRTKAGDQLRLMQRTLTDGLTTALYPDLNALLFTVSQDGQVVLAEVQQPSADGTPQWAVSLMSTEKEQSTILPQPDSLITTKQMPWITISPDNKTVAWTVQTSTRLSGIGSAVVVANLATGDSEVVLSGQSVYEIIFTADSQHLLIRAYDNAISDLSLYEVTLATRAIRQISDGQALDWDIASQPIADSAKALVIAQASAGLHELFLADSVNGTLTRLNGLAIEGDDLRATGLGMVWDAVISQNGSTVGYFSSQAGDHINGVYALNLAECNP